MVDSEENKTIYLMLPDIANKDLPANSYVDFAFTITRPDTSSFAIDDLTIIGSIGTLI